MNQQNKLGGNVVVLRRFPANPTTNANTCWAAPTCALRRGTLDKADEIVSAVYALITKAGEVVRGAQNVGSAAELHHLMRALDLLAIEIHDRYQQILQHELEASHARAMMMRERQNTAMSL